MTNKPKAIGTAAETAVVRWLNANGWPHAERRALHGAYDRGDITGTPGICWEVKGGKAAHTASDAKVLAWMTDLWAAVDRTHSDVGILVMTRSGIGATRAGAWWAVVDSHRVGIAGPRFCLRASLMDIARHLRHRGFGDELKEDR